MNSLGEALKSEREKRNISLEEVAAKTNISLKALTSLEKDEIKNIPGKFYFKNYIKNYLNAVNADTKEFFEAYKEEIDALYLRTHSNQEPYCSKLKYSRFKRKNLFFSLLMTAIVFITAFYLIYSNKDTIFSGWNLKSVNVPLPETVLDFSRLEGAGNSRPDYSPINVAIEFTDNCWAQIYRGREKIVEKVFQKEEKLDLKGYEVTVNAGNPGALKLLINGKEVTYLKNLARSEKIVITPAGLDEIFKK